MTKYTPPALLPVAPEEDDGAAEANHGRRDDETQTVSATPQPSRRAAPSGTRRALTERSAMNQEPERYPMPLFVTLAVRDLAASAAWYQEALGFTHVLTVPGIDEQPILVHLRWMKHADLMLIPEAQDAPLPASKSMGVTLTFALFDKFGGDIDALAERAASFGSTIAVAPHTQPWGVREMTILDPDGYCLIFTAPAPVEESEAE